jgi:hypothetical protein
VGSQLVKNMPIGIASFQASTLENGQSLADYIAKSRFHALEVWKRDSTYRQLRTAWRGRRWFVGTNAHLTERALSVHSSRNRTRGSTDSARCAGIHVATRPRKAIATTTPASTNGSRGVA